MRVDGDLANSMSEFERMREILKDIIPLIRFPLMTEEELALHVHTTDILTDSQWTTLLRALMFNKYLRFGKGF